MLEKQLLHRLRGSVLAVENAKSHYRAARLLAEAGCHGLGTSMLILAAEEATKAANWFADAVGYPLVLADETDITRSHKTRLRLGGALFRIGYFATKALVNESPSRELLVEIMRNLLGAYSGGRVPEDLQAYDAWWSKANALKQRGFYVDEVDEDWSTPAAITAKEFESARGVTQMLVNGARVLSIMVRRYDGVRQMREYLPPNDEWMSELAMEVEQQMDSYGESQEIIFRFDNDSYYSGWINKEHGYYRVDGTLHVPGQVEMPDVIENHFKSADEAFEALLKQVRRLARLGGCSISQIENPVNAPLISEKKEAEIAKNNDINVPVLKN